MSCFFHPPVAVSEHLLSGCGREHGRPDWRLLPAGRQRWELAHYQVQQRCTWKYQPFMKMLLLMSQNVIKLFNNLNLKLLNYPAVLTLAMQTSPLPLFLHPEILFFIFRSHFPWIMMTLLTKFTWRQSHSLSLSLQICGLNNIIKLVPLF